MKIETQQPIRTNMDLATGKMYGIINLPFVAKNNNMTISIGEKEISPKFFNLYGEPIFSESYLKKFHNEQANYSENGEIIANISYEKEELVTPVVFFDTSDSLKNYLTSLEDFHKLIRMRKMCTKLNSYERLCQFVVFGKYFLDCFGNIHLITKTKKPVNFKKCQDIYFNYDFIQLFGEYEYEINPFILIPSPTAKCVCCNKNFTIEDLRLSNFSNFKGKLQHISCKSI